jgi:peptidase S41-like protein
LDHITTGMRLASGTTQWKTVRALQELTTTPNGATVSLTIDAPAGAREIRLTSNGGTPAPEARPEQVAELTSGVWYVDLTRATWAQLQPRLPTISGAAAIIFDMRGYPTDAGSQILSHLIDAAESDRWMHVPKIVGPFFGLAGWTDIGWNLKPASPHLPGKIVFMTDGRAISYAESVMGYVSSHHLGTIVGATTAGTNGNVAAFSTPGGFSITFTGMRVTQHDGGPHHLVGVQPEIPVSPTIAGLRAGHDEVLDRALAVIRGAQN